MAKVLPAPEADAKYPNYQIKALLRLLSYHKGLEKANISYTFSR